MTDIEIGGKREGIGIRAVGNGLHIWGWYDSIVGMEGGFVTWDQLDELRKKAKRRRPYQVTA